MVSGNNYRILVIDDLASIHRDFRKILLSEENEAYQSLNKMNEMLEVQIREKNKLPPFEIDSAYQGQEGIMLVQKALEEERPYAVTFVDVQMPPGEDGVATISRMWEMDPNLQIVICTAYAKYSWADLMNRFGETDRLFVLKKPFDNIEVIQLAISLAKKWNLNRKLEEQVLKTATTKSEKGKKTFDTLEETLTELKSINDKIKSQNLLYKQGKKEGRV